MPYLGPGVPNTVALPVYATWVFTPTPSVTATVRIWNTGSNTAYVGKSGVNQADSFPIAPGNSPVHLQNITQSLYACSDVTVGALLGTLSTSYTAGSTVFVTAASVSTASIASGAVIVLGSTVNSGWEAVVVGTHSTSYTTFGTTALVGDHGAVPFYAGTALPTSVVVQAGVV